MKRIFFILLVLAFSRMAVAQSGSIYGEVLESKTLLPLKNVRVTVISLKMSVTSNDSGYFFFDDIPAGRYQLSFTRSGYQTKTLNDVQVIAGEKTRLTIYLEKKINVPEYEFFDHDTKSKPKHTLAHGHRSKKDRAGRGTPVPPPPHEKHPGLEDAVVFEREAAPVASESGLKAGFADDNQQFNYFLKFLKKYSDQAPHYDIPISERIKLQVLDEQGKYVANADVAVYQGKRLLAKGKTYADGSFFIYPVVIGVQGKKMRVAVDYEGARKNLTINRDGKRSVVLRLDKARKTFQQIPLDLLFILDTTGSMGEEIARLKSTIDIINANLATVTPRPAIRYGMVLYRDKDDDYCTKTVPFTSDLEQFRQALQPVQAEGGGDTPEDLQAALQVAVKEMNWNPDGIRLAFIITDAAPHLDYGQDYTYVQAAKDAKQQAIKIFSVGTGGLDIAGEYVLRQIAQFTYGKYIFLTYGEHGESHGGHPGSVSHHTGANFQTDKLESIIIRFAKQELSYQSDLPLAQGEPYFQADKIPSEEKEQTLRKLFVRVLGELKDYSALAIPEGTRLSVMPIQVKIESLANNAEYFTEQLIFAASKDATFKLVERKDMQFIARELGLELGGFVDEEQAAKVGEFLGADMLVLGNLFFKDNRYEIFFKLERVSTAEILSVTRVKIDPRLGL